MTETLQATIGIGIAIGALVLGCFFYALAHTPATLEMDADRGWKPDEHADDDNWGI